MPLSEVFDRKTGR